jgi:hypothetical protein
MSGSTTESARFDRRRLSLLARQGNQKANVSRFSLPEQLGERMKDVD